MSPLRSILSICLISAAAAGAGPTPVRWEPLYEPGQGGATVSIAVSPHDTNVLVSGGDMLSGAISRDRGERWGGVFGFASYELGDVTFHPSDPNVVWFGTCMGPYVSTDGGANFVERRDGMPKRQGGKYTVIVEKILFDPADENRLLAIGGTSRRWAQADSFGWVWESRDGGQTWSHLSTVTADGGDGPKEVKGLNLVAAAFAAGRSDRVYALGADAGVFVSGDGGRTWSKHTDGLPHPNVHRLAVHPRDPDTLWVSLNTRKRKEEKLHDAGGIYKSTDGGRTWRDASGDLPRDRDANGHFTAGYEALAVSPVDPDVIWTCDNRWNTGTVYKTEDGGRSWRAVATKGNVGLDDAKRPDGAAIGDAFRLKVATFGGCALTGMAADPKDPLVAYGFGTEYILRTTDGGKTWTDISAEPAGDGGAWRGRGYTGWCSNNVAYNPYKPGQWVLQGMDAARAWVSDDDLNSFRNTATSPHPWLGGNDVTFARDGTMFVTTGQFGQSNGIVRSIDGGRTWTTLAGDKHGLPEGGWSKGPAGLGAYVHPDDSNRAWVALGGKMYATGDRGETWAVVNEGNGFGHLAPDPTKPGRFYVKGKDGVYVTADGKIYTNVGGPRPAGRGRINCDALGRVYACSWREGRVGVWRYTPADTSDVTNGTWERLLDDYHAMEVNADPTDPDRLALVTSEDPFFDGARANGVWLSSDAGRTWFAANDNLPMLRANAVTFDPTGTKLVVGTYGRGFYTAAWPKDYGPVGDRSYATTAEDRDAAEPRASILGNGRMTDAAGDKPAGWTGTFGDADAARDTDVFRSAPASLRVRPAKADGDGGMAFQTVQGYAGKTVRLSGYVRAAGNGEVNVAIQSFDEAYKRNDFKQVKYVKGAGDWSPFEASVTIPSWAARFNVLLLVKGDGTAWLDDVALAPPAGGDPAPQQASAAAAAPAAAAASAASAASAGAPDELPITHVARDLGDVDYTYGESWQKGSTVTTGRDGDVTYLQIDATEHGGGGVVLNGADITPAGQTHLAVRARLMPGNEAAALNVNIQSTGRTVTFDLTKLSADRWTTLAAPLPGDAGLWVKVDQLQFQGANFSPAAKPLKVQVDRIGTTSADERANAAARQAAAADPTAAAPPKGKPDVPAWGFYPAYPQAWMQTFRGQLDRTKKGGVDVAFVGDSITQGWGGKEAWKRHFQPIKAVNYGIGGDSTRQVLYRLEHGLLDGLTPKAVVLMIGTNNLYDDVNGGSEAEIADGIAACVAAVRKKCPDAKVLLVGVLPRQNEWFTNRIEKVNAVIAKLDDGRHVRFLDLSGEFQTATGKVKPDLYDRDQLHLAAKGYDVWAEKMRPLLDEMTR